MLLRYVVTGGGVGAGVIARGTKVGRYQVGLLEH